MKTENNKKVVFCQVAWMKYYAGNTEDDRPCNGGSYIKENEDGGEVYNFLPYNHKCYGYVMHQGELHIERFDKTLKNHSETTDVTVVWVATDGKKSKIVGWYEHATMYRDWQLLRLYDESEYDYNFVADAEDCYLIDESQRDFVIPRASIVGKGRGMGQSQVWYADSEYAQENIIPEVLEYLDSMKEKCDWLEYTKEDLSVRAEDTGLTTEELLEQAKCAWEEEKFEDAFSLANLAVDNDDIFQTRILRARFFAKMWFISEAEEEYKRALSYKEDVNALHDLMAIEIALGNTFLAIEIGKKICASNPDNGCRINTMCDLIKVYIEEHQWDEAEKLLPQYKKAGGNKNWANEKQKKINEMREEYDSEK